MSRPAPMETLREAMKRLSGQGFRSSLRAKPEGFEDVHTGVVRAPEELVVEEIVRFEGASDPDDELALFALRSRDGSLRGTFVTSFGVGVDPEAAELVRRLGDRRRD